MLQAAAINKTGAMEHARSHGSAGACRECSRNAIGRLSRAGDKLTVLPAILVALLPKCPLCLAAWLGVPGSAGALSWLSSARGLPLVAAILILVVAYLTLRVWNSRDLRPPVVSLIGTALLLGGRYRADAPLWSTPVWLHSWKGHFGACA